MFKSSSSIYCVFVATPLWPNVRMKLTLSKLGTWSPPGFPKTQNSIAGVKTPCIGVFLISLEKVLKCRCPKWPRMSHLDIYSPNYGQKKGPRIKLVIWLPTTKSRESTRSLRALGECNMALESSRRELQDWFKAHPDRRSGRKVMMAQSPGSPNRDSFRTPLWKSRDKGHLGVGAVEQRREYYMGEGGGFPRARAVVSQVSPRSPVACSNTKRVQNEF
jgi:hypothetical protein